MSSPVANSSTASLPKRSIQEVSLNQVFEVLQAHDTTFKTPSERSAQGFAERILRSTNFKAGVPQAHVACIKAFVNHFIGDGSGDRAHGPDSVGDDTFVIKVFAPLDVLAQDKCRVVATAAYVMLDKDLTSLDPLKAIERMAKLVSAAFGADPTRDFLPILFFSATRMKVLLYHRTGDILHSTPEKFRDNLAVYIQTIVAAADVGRDSAHSWDDKKARLTVQGTGDKETTYLVRDATYLRAPNSDALPVGPYSVLWDARSQQKGAPHCRVKDVWHSGVCLEKGFLKKAQQVKGVEQMIRAIPLGPTEAFQPRGKKSKGASFSKTRILLTEQGPSLEHFKTPLEFLRTILSALKGASNLAQMDILHRNISPRVILLGNPDNEPGWRGGVLSDLSNAAYVDAQTGKLIGGAPVVHGDPVYQSIRILKSAAVNGEAAETASEHDYFDEIESIVYVTFVVVCGFDESGKRKPLPGPVAAWAKASPSAMAQLKLDFIRKDLPIDDLEISAFWGPRFHALLTKLHNWCRHSLTMRRRVVLMGSQDDAAPVTSWAKPQFFYGQVEAMFRAAVHGLKEDAKGGAEPTADGQQGKEAKAKEEKAKVAQAAKEKAARVAEKQKAEEAKEKKAKEVAQAAKEKKKAKEVAQAAKEKKAKEVAQAAKEKATRAAETEKVQDAKKRKDGAVAAQKAVGTSHRQQSDGKKQEELSKERGEGRKDDKRTLPVTDRPRPLNWDPVFKRRPAPVLETNSKEPVKAKPIEEPEQGPVELPSYVPKPLPPSALAKFKFKKLADPALAYNTPESMVPASNFDSDSEAPEADDPPLIAEAETECVPITMEELYRRHFGDDDDEEEEEEEDKATEEGEALEEGEIAEEGEIVEEKEKNPVGDSPKKTIPTSGKPTSTLKTGMKRNAEYDSDMVYDRFSYDTNGAVRVAAKLPRTSLSHRLYN